VSDTSPSEFSFDLYPGLDADLQAAYVRNVQQGNASPELVATAGIAAAVNETLAQQSAETTQLDPRISEWENQELNMPDSALNKWRRYGGHLGTQIHIPSTAGELQHAVMKPGRYEGVIEKLYNARNALYQDGEVTPTGGENIGDTMHLAAVPWQMFRDNLGDLEGVMNKLRGVQGINSEDYIGPNIIKLLQGNHRFYKSWDEPGVFYTAAEYLDHKIEQDGPWGLMLVQTGDEPGAKSLIGQSPDDLTGRANHTPVIAGQEVGSFGLFEWLALTLQEDPKQLSTQYYSWMIANRTEVTGDPRVPIGDWNDVQVKSNLYYADNQRGVARPRLAVM
jgi:hypothetical protein